VNTDEREIFDYLHTWGESFVSAKEVCRRASTKKRYGQDPAWALPILLGMAQDGVIEKDLMGRYRVKPGAEKDEDEGGISPDLEKILDEPGEAEHQ